MHRLIIAAAALASVTTAQAAPPDLGGLWTSGSLTPLERPKDFKALTISEPEARAYEARRRNQPPPIEDDVGGADSEWWETDEPLQRVRGQPRTSLIVSPADGKLPFTAAAAARNKDRTARRKLTTDNPEDRGRGDRCLPGALAGPPMINGVYNNNFRIVQTRDHLVIQAEYLGDVRIVRLDPRARRGPPHVRRWLGESIGHWEGDTLVIVTTNFTATEVDAPDGDPAADAVVIERLTRLGPDRLGYAFTVRNPSLYVMPWQGEMELRTTAGPLFEVACHEGNYALRSMLAGSRQAEAPAPAQDGTRP